MFTDDLYSADIVFTCGIYDRSVVYMSVKNDATFEYLDLNGFNPKPVGRKREMSHALARSIISYSIQDGIKVYASRTII